MDDSAESSAKAMTPANAIATESHQRPAIIAGERVQTQTSLLDVDPSTGERLATVAFCQSEHIDAAVIAARRTHELEWSRTEPKVRGRILRNLAQRLLTEKEHLARLESHDTGKPLRQAASDVEVAARYFEYYGSVVEAFHGDEIPSADGYLAYTRHEPFGVTAHIVPWNYPLQIGSRTVSAALAAGNCCVLKPAEQAPLTLIRLGEIALEAGLPAGALNIVPGDGATTGAALASHSGIDHLSFTGSVEVARKVGLEAARSVIPIGLELGGKSPNIVMEDADLDDAGPVIVRSILQNAGQTCSAGSRLLIHRRRYEEVIDAIATLMSSASIGPGSDDPDLGPLISAAQVARVIRYVASAASSVVTGGSRAQVANYEGGYFFQPTLIAGVSADEPIAKDEIFGPVLVALPFDDPHHAVELANAADYGLIAALWTNEISLAHRMALQLRCGQVYVNTYGAGGGVEYPFGGTKMSGFGREKGFEALRTFTASKTVVVRMDRL
jgi:aldehyde dehydrogenase (NAD+)/betaine-aldehyde dehydrogenase